MAISPETFSQVKDILKKLDRSISDARTARLRGDEVGEAAPSNGGAAGPRGGVLDDDGGPLIGGPSDRPSEDRPGRARAKPKRPNGSF